MEKEGEEKEEEEETSPLPSLMYKKVADAQYRSKLSNELMMYHMKVRSNYDVSYEGEK